MRSPARSVLAIGLVVGSLSGCGDDAGGATAAASTTGLPATTSTAAATTTAIAPTTVSSTTTLAPTTTTEPLEFQIARESMEVWNTGDLDAYLAMFGEGAIIGAFPAHSESVRDGLQFFMTLGDQTVLEECEEWAGGRTRCHEISLDDLSGPVGGLVDAHWDFWITDGMITKLTASTQDASARWFVVEMSSWLQEAHPEVWGSVFAVTAECGYHDQYNCWESWSSNPRDCRCIARTPGRVRGPVRRILALGVSPLSPGRRLTAHC